MALQNIGDNHIEKQKSLLTDLIKEINIKNYIPGQIKS